MGRSPGEGNGNPLQYSCLENPIDGGAWQATVHGVAKSQTRQSDFTFTFKLGPKWEEKLEKQGVTDQMLTTLSHWYQYYIWASQVAQWQRICCQCRSCERHGLDPWVRKIPWRRKWQPTPVCWPGKSHGQRSLAGYSPRGHKDSDSIGQPNNKTQEVEGLEVVPCFFYEVTKF